MRVLVSWVLSALLLILMAHFIPGFSISGFGTALIAVIVIGFINATLGWFLKIVGFPLTIITLGLFLLVVNAIVLKVAAAILPGFSIHGFFPAFVAAILLSLLHLVVRKATEPRPSR